MYAATQVYVVPVWWTEDTDKVDVGCGLWIWLIRKLLGRLYATMSSILDSSISSYTVTLYSPAGRSVMLTDPLLTSPSCRCSVVLMVY